MAQPYPNKYTPPRPRSTDRPESSDLPRITDRPQIMGILNLTPDSFSDGGQHNDPQQGIQHALVMASQGADIIDVGGESTRPGAQRISPKEQLERVLPVIRSLRQRLDDTHPKVKISIDTTRADVADAAVDAGAGILNDVSAGREDPNIYPLAAERNLPIVLMHMQGQPGTMQDQPTYADVTAEVHHFLLERAQAALDAGIHRHQIILDPGIGFGKTTEHNLTLLRSLPGLVSLGYPIMIGASRKRFLKDFNPRPRDAPQGEESSGSGGEPGNRLGGTCAITAHCVAAGVKLLRVHDVAPNRQAADLAWALVQPQKRPTP
jgi:dihydropteroate synthase